jgi:hypothetical protein
MVEKSKAPESTLDSNHSKGEVNEVPEKKISHPTRMETKNVEISQPAQKNIPEASRDANRTKKRSKSKSRSRSKSRSPPQRVHREVTESKEKESIQSRPTLAPKEEEKPLSKEEKLRLAQEKYKQRQSQNQGQ